MNDSMVVYIMKHLNIVLVAGRLFTFQWSLFSGFDFGRRSPWPLCNYRHVVRASFDKHFPFSWLEIATLQEQNKLSTEWTGHTISFLIFGTVQLVKPYLKVDLNNNKTNLYNLLFKGGRVYEISPKSQSNYICQPESYLII